MAGKVQKIDLSSQAFARDPFPTYASWREVGQVFQTRLPLLGKTWVATTYQAASEVLKGDETFVMEAKKVGKTFFIGILRLLPRILRVFSDNMLAHDNPDHRRLRRLVEQAFSRHSVENLRGRIGVLCDGLLDGLAGRETVDLLEEWARPLPVAVICELLGLPDEDRPKFTRWIKAFFLSASVFGMLLAVPRILSLLKYFRRHFEQCRRQPRPGLMSALVQARQEGDQLSEDELLAMAFLLLFAGFETTVHLLSGGTLALLTTPEQKERLLKGLVPAAAGGGGAAPFRQPGADVRAALRGPGSGVLRPGASARRLRRGLAGGRERRPGAFSRPGETGPRAQPQPARSFRFGHPLLPWRPAGPGRSPGRLGETLDPLSAAGSGRGRVRSEVQREHVSERAGGAAGPLAVGAARR